MFLGGVMRRKDESKKSVILDFIDEYYNEYNAMAMSISKAKVDVVTLRRRDEDLNILFMRLYEDMVPSKMMIASPYTAGAKAKRLPYE